MQPRNALAIGILITIASFGFTSGPSSLSPSATAGSQRMVSLYVDGSKRLFATEATTVGEVLERANVKLGDHDIVEPSASTHITPQGQFNINVFRARDVLVLDGFKSYHIKTAYQSPRLIALAAGLTVYAEDTYRPEVITDIVDADLEGAAALGEKVTLDRAKPLTIKVDGATRTIRTQAETIGDALKGAGIALGLQDTISKPLTAPVVPGATIQITRVSEVIATLTQTLPRSVKTISDPTVMKGQTKIRTEGSDGSKTVTYRIHYKDGVETSREALQVVKEIAPVTKVIVEGTKVLFAGSVEYWRPLVEKAAAEWGIDPNMMMRIMACESKGNATVVSQFIVNGEHPMGLFQYLPSTWRGAGGTDDNILDGPTQIKLTAKKMALYGTGPWACK